MTPPVFYAVLQLPGLILVLVGLWLALERDWLEPATAVVTVLVWILKDALLYPLYRPALARPPATGAAALIGTTGVVTVALAPRGQVRVGGERWSAVAVPDSPGQLPTGQRVRVIDVRGLVLQVAACPGPQPGERT